MSGILNDDDSSELNDAPVPNELESLKARANQMNLKYHPNIGVDALRDKVNAAMADEPQATKDTPPDTPPEAVEAAVETDSQRRYRKRREATALVRIRVQCMNPAKKEWAGEIISVGNSLVGSLTKYIPFTDAEDGWHVPHMLYKHLLERQCQVFVTKTDARGNKTRVGKLIREFAIELLPDLTADELKDLAQRQAMSKSID